MKKNFNNIDVTLRKLLKKYDLAHLYSIETIKKGWVDMDKTIAAHSQPIEYDPETKNLKLRIENSSWKNEFFNNRQQLLVKVKNYFTTIEINIIEFI